MPNQFDFVSLKKLLIQHGEKTIQTFAKTPHNIDVYAFVLDAQATYGTVNFKWNTLEGFALTRTFEYYQHYSNDKLYGLCGLKYSVGDFRYEDPRNLNLDEWGMKYREDLDALWETDEEQADEVVAGFMAVLVEVVKELTPALEHLNLTDDFIAYAVDHDEDEMKFLVETVSAAQMDKAFPELKAYESYKARVYMLSPIEQASFWYQALADFEQGRESEAVVQLQSLSRSSHDVQDELVKLGEISIPLLLTGLELALGHLQGSIDMNEWTFQKTILDIGIAGENEINRLQAIYNRQALEHPEDHRTKNTLRVLNSIDPQRFPDN
ncbi:DUF4303 domain-containing protein [Paenibacillus sp. KS-LC4]|uniref:DUF4303 domain-containing protein n=1 Tax=Paenibacillus sp. KS-LC4 TaxID=2979727 RepID=UPI0030CD3CBF